MIIDYPTLGEMEPYQPPDYSELIKSFNDVFNQVDADKSVKSESTRTFD